MKISGIVLIILGVIALIYGELSYTSHKKAVDVGPLQVTKAEHHSLPIPPAVGIVVIIGGACLFYFGAKQRA